MEAIGLLTIIISFILLIVFFVIADRIGKIQKDLRRLTQHLAPDPTEHNCLAQREAFKGNTDEAIDNYQNLMFEIEIHDKSVNRPGPYWRDLRDKTNEELEKLKNNRA